MLHLPQLRLGGWYLAHPYQVVIIVSSAILGIAFESLIHHLRLPAKVSILEATPNGPPLAEPPCADLVIIDDTPPIDPLDLAHTLRAKGCTAPVLVVSSDPNLEPAIEEMDAALVVKKPGVVDELQKLLPQLLQNEKPA